MSNFIETTEMINPAKKSAGVHLLHYPYEVLTENFDKLIKYLAENSTCQRKN